MGPAELLTEHLVCYSLHNMRKNWYPLPTKHEQTSYYCAGSLATTESEENLKRAKKSRRRVYTNRMTKKMAHQSACSVLMFIHIKALLKLRDHARPTGDLMTGQSLPLVKYPFLDRFEENAEYLASWSNLRLADLIVRNNLTGPTKWDGYREVL